MYENQLVEIQTTIRWAQSHYDAEGRANKTPSNKLLWRNQAGTKPFQRRILGHNAYRHRMAIEANSEGKSGVAKVTTYTLHQSDEEIRITLMSIHDKGGIPNASNAYLRQLIAAIESQSQ